jgi:hypothetical protein
MLKSLFTSLVPAFGSLLVANCSAPRQLTKGVVAPRCLESPAERNTTVTKVSSLVPAPSDEPVAPSPRRVDQTQIASANESVSAYRDTLTTSGPIPVDYSCPPALSPALAEILFQTAEHLIKKADEHVSPGALEVILPLLQLAAHSGHQATQYRYGGYIVGYYLTDEMFWPREKEIASDALAMLRIVATDAPALVGDNKIWILGNFLPTGDKTPFDRAWLRRAKELEAHYRKCQSGRTEPVKPPEQTSSAPTSSP